jgi:hypothetical protein
VKFMFERTVLGFLLLGGLALWSPNSKAEDAGKGYHYYRDEVTDVPWSIQVLKVDRSSLSSNLQFHTTFGDGKAIGLVPLPTQIQSFGQQLGRPIAAINGDYYQNKAPYKGDPKGIQISRGEVISAPFDWTCFWVDTSGQPHMGMVKSQFSVTWPNGKATPFGLNEQRLPDQCVLYTEAVGSSTRTSGGVELVLERAASASKFLPLEIGEDYVVVVREVREGGNTPTGPGKVILSIGPRALRSVPKVQKGAVLRFSTGTEPSLKGCQTAISGGPALIRDGKVQVGWSAIRHPRTGLGWNKDNLFLVQVDGRQTGHSVGMTYSELATYMEKLGCEQALNLDGGGSATFWMLGQVMNSPSQGKERGIANGLILVQKTAGSADPQPAKSVQDEVD